MTLPLVYNDGWVLGAEGLTPEDLASKPQKQRTEKKDAFNINLVMSKISKDKGKNGSSGNGRNGQRVEKVEVEPQGTVIVKGENVVISERNGALVIQQRYVEVKTIIRKVLVRRRRNGEVTKEKVTQRVKEKPYTLMIPAMYRDNPVEYLKAVKPKNGGKRVIKEAIALLSKL